MSPGLLSGFALEGCAMLILLAPLALAGLALTNAGLGRSRGASHAILSSIAAIAVAAVVYCVCGFSWEGAAALPVHSFVLDGRSWDWLARQPLFLHGLTEGSPASLSMLLQIFTVGLAALIPLGAGADRWRLSAICLSTALLSGVTFPLFAHWVWGGGWLAQLGANFGMGGGFLDPGGAAAVQMVGGLTALAIASILGPRGGKFGPDGMAAAIPGHNIVYVVFGCFLMTPGWMALNCAGAILFAGAPLFDTPFIAVNTLLCASASLLAALAITWRRFGKPDASLCANGWVGGLAASSAICSLVTPVESLFIGFVAGIVVAASIELLEVFFAIDDPTGSISVHGAAGLWGLLAAGIFRIAVPPDLAGGRAHGGLGQFEAQLVGVATLLGFVLPLTYGLNLLLNRFASQRVDPEGERLGMDLHQLGASAYPEFVVHSDEFNRR